MKTWMEAKIVELNITETANGDVDSYFEFDINGVGYNNDLSTGGDSDTNGGGSSSTPDTLS